MKIIRWLDLSNSDLGRPLQRRWASSHRVALPAEVERKIKRIVNAVPLAGELTLYPGAEVCNNWDNRARVARLHSVQTPRPVGLDVILLDEPERIKSLTAGWSPSDLRWLANCRSGQGVDRSKMVIRPAIRHSTSLE